MKVAISCDYILERSHYAEVIENICEIFPEATLFCFAHKKGSVLGHIEHRQIRSTYLSNFVKNPEEFYTHSNKLPSLAKNLFISCDYDLIINISKGFSQGFAKCEKTKLVSFVYDLDLDQKITKTLLQKMFSPFVHSWIKKTFQKAEVILASRQDLVDLIKTFPLLKKVEHMPPPFRVSDYALFPKDMFKHHFLAIEAKGLSVEKAQNLIKWMEEWEMPFQFIGGDEHLGELKSHCKENTFFGNRCSGEHAPVIAASKAFISFNDEDFPSLSLGAMATGRPVILSVRLKKWVSGVGIHFVDQFNKDSLHKAILELTSEDQLDSKKVRAHVMDYHDIKFKAGLKRILDPLIKVLSLKSNDPNSKECC